MIATWRTRAAFWSAAALRRFFDGTPKMNLHKTPVATLPVSGKSPFRSDLLITHEPGGTLDTSDVIWKPGRLPDSRARGIAMPMICGKIIRQNLSRDK
jgi:hypothetical protein